MTVLSIIRDMLAKGFTPDTAVDLSFADGTVARCRVSHLTDGSLRYAEMCGELTTYYSIDEMRSMGLIAIVNVHVMEKYRVEFNKIGTITGAGIWETLDEICEVTAACAQDAIDDVVYALASEDDGYDWRSYAWRACECSDDDSNWTYVKYDEVIDYDD